MDLNQISAETLDEIKKATTAGVNISTGLQGVDLSDVVSLIPVNTPFYNQLPKTSPEQGARFAQWRALTNVNNTQPDPGTPYDYAAPLVNISEIDVAAAYGKIGTGYTVTKDAINRAKGYADAKAIALFNCLNQYKIAADKKLLGGQSFALAAPTGVTVVPSTTGGSIPASTQVQVQVAARTLSNYNYGGSGAATAIVSATTSAAGGTNSAVATVTAVRGAVAYDWFVGGFYLTTTTVNKVTITTIPTANQAVPLLPGIYAVAPAAVPTVDGSAKPNDFNGLLASLAGDYALPGSYGQVTAGQGVPSGATFQSLDGAGFTINGANVAELDRLNAAIYASVQLSPTAYMMSSQTASELSGGCSPRRPVLSRCSPRTRPRSARTSSPAATCPGTSTRRPAGPRSRSRSTRTWRRAPSSPAPTRCRSRTRTSPTRSSSVTRPGVRLRVRRVPRPGRRRRRPPLRR